MNYRQRHILIRKRRHSFHAAAAAAVMRIVHRDNNVCTQLICQRLGFVAGHCAKAAGVYHKDIGSEQHVLLSIRQEAAVVAHMDELEPVPIYNMYLVFSAQAAIACVVKGIYHRHFIRALSRRAGELDSGAVIVSAVLVAAKTASALVLMGG